MDSADHYGDRLKGKLPRRANPRQLFFRCDTISRFDCVICWQPFLDVVRSFHLAQRCCTGVRVQPLCRLPSFSRTSGFFQTMI